MIHIVVQTFNKSCLTFFLGFRSFVKSQHVQMFDDQVKVMQNLDSDLG